MSDDGVALSHLHEVPWSNVEGAFVRVKQEIDNNDPLAHISEWSEENVDTEERRGTITGRAQGTGLYYDADRGESIPTGLGPAIFIDTPQDTILEVRTDKPGNELLEFQPEVDDAE